MKQFFFVAAATALTLSSCSDNEINNVVVEKSQTPISINVYSQSQTRSVTETTLASLRADGFMFAVNNGTTDPFVGKATYQNNAWTYGKDIYWPTNESTAVEFFGIYPSTLDINATSGKSTITIDGDTDVVAAYLSSSYSSSTSGSVSLSFGHVMADVLISAKGDDSNFYYTVNSIDFSVPSSVDYTFSTGSCKPAADAKTISIDYPIAETAGEFSTRLIDLGEDIVLPALAAADFTITMNINYTVTNTGGQGQNTLTKQANILLKAGCKNIINLTLPAEQKPLSFDVNEVSGWGTDNTINDPVLQ